MKTKTHELLEILLQDYNPTIRPVINRDDPVKASINIRLTQIVDFVSIYNLAILKEKKSFILVTRSK